MRRIVRLVRAADQQVNHQHYQDGLQAMWEDRWSLLGAPGRADWVQRHGEEPPRDCPLLAPAELKCRVRLHLNGSAATPAGRLLLSLHRLFRSPQRPI